MREIMGDLDDFLKGSEQPVIAETQEPETPEVTEQPETVEEPKGPVRDDKGRFAPKGETEAETPPAEEQPTIPVKALQEERRKRQESEERIRTLEAQLSQTQNPPQPAPDIWEDTQGWQQNFGQEVVSNAVNQATLNARIEMSEMMMRQSHPDFGDKKTVWQELVGKTPGLFEKGLADPHPWNFAYNYVTNHQRMEQLSATNVADLEAKLREQIRAELTAQPEPKPTPSIPDTLADQQSARGSIEALVVPTLDQILKR
jgi:hypothetical protein